MDDAAVIGEVFFPLARLAARYMWEHREIDTKRVYSQYRRHDDEFEVELIPPFVAACRVGAVRMASLEMAKNPPDGKTLRDAFAAACARGAFDTVVWLSSLDLHAEFEDVGEPDVQVLASCCRRGDLRTAMFLVKMFPKMARFVLDASPGSPFDESCVEGHLPVSEWLADRFSLSRSVVCDSDNRLLRYLCSEGRHEMAEWLAVRFAIDARDAASWSRSVFFRACARDFIGVLRFMHERLGITADDVRANDNFAVGEASAGGHLETVVWLVDTFGLAAEDIRADENRVLREACGGNHLELAKYVTARFSLGRQDARSHRNGALCSACAHGHLDVVAWMFDTFGLDETDVRANDMEVFGTSCISNLEVARFLADRIGLTRDTLGPIHRPNPVNVVFRYTCRSSDKYAEAARWFSDRFGSDNEFGVSLFGPACRMEDVD